MNSTDEERLHASGGGAPDREVLSYGALLRQPFAASILDPRKLGPRLAVRWIWLAMAMATFGCIANRAVDRDIESVLSAVQPTVSALATFTAVAAVIIVSRSALAHRQVLASHEADARAFFAMREEWLRSRGGNTLSRQQADAILHLTTEETQEVTVATRQVATLLRCGELLLILSPTVVLGLALRMREPLTQVLSWLDFGALVALLLAVMPIIDRWMAINRQAVNALRGNEKQALGWVEDGDAHPATGPGRAPSWRGSWLAPGTILALLWLLALLVGGLVHGF